MAIVGLAGSGKSAPFDDESFEIWTLNQGIRIYKDKRVDKLFDLHDWGAANYRPDYYSDLYAWGDKLVNTYNYPYQDIAARYGWLLENSIPMMMLYAGYHDYKDIYLFGIDDGEFTSHGQYQRMGQALYHAMGALRAEGRRVYICNLYALDYSGIYGVTNMVKTELPNGFEFKARGVF